MLQSFTSAKFMMLNFTGAIGNITIGESAIAGEYIAKEYFTPTGWLKGKNMWRQAVPSFIRGMANEDSTTLADALVKFMNIVDFDEVNNRPTVHLDADTVLNKIRDFMWVNILCRMVLCSVCSLIIEWLKFQMLKVMEDLVMKL